MNLENCGIEFLDINIKLNNLIYLNAKNNKIQSLSFCKNIRNVHTIKMDKNNIIDLL